MSIMCLTISAYGNSTVYLHMALEDRFADFRKKAALRHFLCLAHGPQVAPAPVGAQAVAGGRLPGSQRAQREWPSLGNESLFLSATSATLCVSFSSSLNFLLLKEALVDTAQSDLYVKWLRSSDEAEIWSCLSYFLGPQREQDSASEVEHRPTQGSPKPTAHGPGVWHSLTPSPQGTLAQQEVGH